MPATAFNQYNVSCVAAIQLFQPIGFRSHSNNGLCGKMNKELEALERKLEIRNRELAEAHSHIAVLEEKLLKLKQYRRELKSLKEERRTLRKSPERRIGQILLAPYRVLEKPAKDSLEKASPAEAERSGNSDCTERIPAMVSASSREYAGVAADAR